MNDIYKQKAIKYKYKYLNLKKEKELEGGNFFNHFTEKRFNDKVDEIIKKYIDVNSDLQLIIIPNNDTDTNIDKNIQDENFYFYNRLTNNGFINQVYKRIKNILNLIHKLKQKHQKLQNHKMKSLLFIIV
jgi:hypothetical protein